MEANRILVPVIAVLLLIVAIEGAILIADDNSGSVKETNNELKDRIIELNSSGGTIYFENGNSYSLSPGENTISVEGDMVHIRKITSVYSTDIYCPISNVTYVNFNR